MSNGTEPTCGRKSFPESVVIIGAGVFGLSTALAIAKQHPLTTVTVVDRLTPPVADGTSVDTTRCIRSGKSPTLQDLEAMAPRLIVTDYLDPIYARLAKKAQKMIKEDHDLQPHLFQQGMTFVCDGRESRFTEVWKSQLERGRSSNPASYEELVTREEVFQRIHGKDSRPPPLSRIGGESHWNTAYCNLEDAFIDAKESIQVYYDRCLKTSTIDFMCGSAVEKILVNTDKAEGVVLQDGTIINAEMVIVAAGAWSNKLVYLGTRVVPIGHEVAWIKISAEEEARWKNMSITTNMSTGLNMFPPYNGEIKILRRSPGYKNTTTVPHPEDRFKKIQISYPRTIVSNPDDVIPSDAEFAMRENLREIMPTLADRPFDRTKICWISTTPTADFLIACHPNIVGVHLATGGSAHAWKFLPIIGDWVVDSIMGTLAQELVAKWAFDRHSGDKDQNAPRMDGEPQELREKVRHRL